MSTITKKGSLLGTCSVSFWLIVPYERRSLFACLPLCMRHPHRRTSALRRFSSLIAPTEQEGYKPSILTHTTWCPVHERIGYGHAPQQSAIPSRNGSKQQKGERANEPRPVSSVPLLLALPCPFLFRLPSPYILYRPPPPPRQIPAAGCAPRGAPLGEGGAGQRRAETGTHTDVEYFTIVTMEEASGRRKRRHRGQKLLDELQMLQMSCLRAKAHRGAKRRGGHCRGLPSSSRPMKLFFSSFRVCGPPRELERAREVLAAIFLRCERGELHEVFRHVRQWRPLPAPPPQRDGIRRDTKLPGRMR